MIFLLIIINLEFNCKFQIILKIKIINILVINKMSFYNSIYSSFVYLNFYFKKFNKFLFIFLHTVYRNIT